MVHSEEIAVELKDISKQFGAVIANHDVSLALKKGEIHGIVGENGAGKSTLMSILYGFYEADSGEILVNDQPVRIRTSKDAIALGIGMVHQHFMLVPPLSVLENLILGAEKGWKLADSKQAAREQLDALSQTYGLEIDGDAIVETLSLGLQQRVEILKTLLRGADVLILDEPTSVLTPAEVEQLFAILRKLSSEGKTIVLITHKLKEIKAITDRVSIMRRGQLVTTRETESLTIEEMANLMVGRRVLLQVERGESKIGDIQLEACNLSLKDARGQQVLDQVSLMLRSGEILGVAGISGNGQSELLDVLSGIQNPDSGEAKLFGEAITFDEPGSIRAKGLAHVPEDRQGRGLVSAFPAHHTAMLGYQGDQRFGNPLFLLSKIRNQCQKLMGAFDVRPGNPELKSSRFSGGNQQKLVLAREFDRDPAVLLIGQPTRGVDVGAIEFIYQRILDFRAAGKAILLVSSELDEVMDLSDRVIVMFQGRVQGEVDPQQVSQMDIGLLMAGAAES